MKINAIIFGATGMVGEGVLHQALEHHEIESVLVIGRRSCGVKHPRMKELIHNDFYDYSAIETQLTGFNACFFCLGVSSVGMKEADYRRVTFDLTMKAASTLAKLNPDMTFCYITGAGTDSTEKGPVMWARVKGMTENRLLELPFKAAYMFRPGFIKPLKGQRNAHTISRIAGALYPLMNIIAPKYICTMEELAKTMILVVKEGFPKQILENSDIVRFAAGRTGTS